MSEHGDSTTPPREIRQWLVDGYNVMHAVLLGGDDRSAFWTAARRRELIERIETLPSRPPPHAADDARSFDSDTGDTLDRCEAPHVIVVFDGPHPQPRGPDEHGVALRFEPSADDWIVGRVRTAEAPAALGVVTSDRQVAGRCRHAGARIVSPGQFLGWCQPPAQSDEAASE